MGIWFIISAALKMHRAGTIFKLPIMQLFYFVQSEFLLCMLPRAPALPRGTRSGSSGPRIVHLCRIVLAQVCRRALSPENASSGYNFYKLPIMQHFLLCTERHFSLHASTRSCA